MQELISLDKPSALWGCCRKRKAEQQFVRIYSSSQDSNPHPQFRRQPNVVWTRVRALDIKLSFCASPKVQNMKPLSRNFRSQKLLKFTFAYFCIFGIETNCVVSRWFYDTCWAEIVKSSGCSTAVEHTPRDREVVGLNPAGCWAFFSSLFSQ